MTRVLHAMAGAPVGGAEESFTRLACALARRGVASYALMRPDAARAARLREAGLEVAEARFGGPLDLATPRKMRRAIDAWKPDIVVTWMNRATAHCPRRRGGDRFVHVGYPHGYYAPKYYRRCDRLFVTTEDMARFYREAGWPADRIDIVPNFAPEIAAEPVKRASLATPEDAKLLLALGRLHVNKGFDTLIRALAALPGHYLWLAGSGPRDAELRRLAAELGVADRIRFLGWRTDAPALLAACDAFVCSSRHEPFGNIILEAWAARAPIVAAASEGPGALIAEGESGLLVPVDDAAALAAAIARVTADPAFAACLAAGGRTAYERGYTEEAVARHTIAVLARIAG